MGTICAPFLQICFCFVMRETPCCLFLIIIKLMTPINDRSDIFLLLKLNKANSLDT